MRIALSIFYSIIFFLAVTGRQSSFAQKLLDKKVNVTVTGKPVSSVLDIISRQGAFYFSYISTNINADSLVSINLQGKTVRQVLERLFGNRYQYREIDNHIIIQPAIQEKWFVVSGVVTDGYTGLPLSDVSIIERQHLVSALTNTSGEFTLLVKESSNHYLAEITVSKGTFFEDTTFVIEEGRDRYVRIALMPSNHTLQDFEITQYSGVERSWLGRTLFSAKLRKQSANLGRFFVDRPFQFSLTPGLGTHGKLSGQVTNAFSFNALGGYAAGVNGFELGGLFNIDKKDVKYVQVAGLLNIVSGGLTGFQVAGLVNKVNDSVKGVQVSGIQTWTNGDVRGMSISGISGHAGGCYSGVQLSGIHNRINNADNDTIALQGLQLAGISNRAGGTVKGVQLSGMANSAGNVHGVQLAGFVNRADDVNGVQITSIYNRAKKVKGVQIGFINIADTVDGYSIGFLNIIKKGYHTLSISSNETFNTNVAFLGGNKRLYGIYTFGINFNTSKKAWGLGYGIGSQIPLTKKIAVLAEITSTTFKTADTTTPNIIKLRTGFNIQLAKKVAIHFGPSLSLVVAVPAPKDGYQTVSPDNAIREFYREHGVSSWLGWQAGINIF